MSALGIAALRVAQGELARGIRGGIAPYGRFRSADIDAYMTLVGLPPPTDPGVEWKPWCAAGVHACFNAAAVDVAHATASMRAAAGANDLTPIDNPCPRTAGALHLWELATTRVPYASIAALPAPGDIFVLDHGKGRGHVGFVASVSPDGQSITSCEPDTNAAGSTTGDAWGERFWKPSDGARGVLKGYLEIG